MDTKTVTLERQDDGSYRMTEAPKAELQQDKPAVTPTAKMEASIAALDKITGIEIAGIPIGAAVSGTALTIALDRLVIARLDPTNKWGMYANLGMALVIKKFGAKYIGDKTADVTALLLTYEALADTVSGFVNKVIPARAAVQQSAGMAQGAGLRQAEMHASNYYARAFGR